VRLGIGGREVAERRGAEHDAKPESVARAVTLVDHDLVLGGLALDQDPEVEAGRAASNARDLHARTLYDRGVESKHRRHTRVEAKVSGHVRTGESAGAAEVENISVGGLFMKTNSPLPVGLALTIELHSAQVTVHLAGRVVGVTPLGVGVAFDVLPADTERKLRELLEELERAPDAATVTAVASPNDTNVRGLLEMLSDALQKLKARDQEIAELKAELRLLKK
jgi:Tfp pilus assembly protein PilZ